MQHLWFIVSHSEVGRSAHGECRCWVQCRGIDFGQISCVSVLFILSPGVFARLLFSKLLHVLVSGSCLHITNILHVLISRSILKVLQMHSLRIVSPIEIESEMVNINVKITAITFDYLHIGFSIKGLLTLVFFHLLKEPLLLGLLVLTTTSFFTEILTIESVDTGKVPSLLRVSVVNRLSSSFHDW